MIVWLKGIIEFSRALHSTDLDLASFASLCALSLATHGKSNGAAFQIAKIIWCKAQKKCGAKLTNELEHHSRLYLLEGKNIRTTFKNTIFYKV